MNVVVEETCEWTLPLVVFSLQNAAIQTLDGDNKDTKSLSVDKESRTVAQTDEAEADSTCTDQTPGLCSEP